MPHDNNNQEAKRLKREVALLHANLQEKTDELSTAQESAGGDVDMTK